MTAHISTSETANLRGSTPPGRRERLRTFMRLKSQRRTLLVALAAVAALAALLLAVTLRDRLGDEVVPLGQGMASVAKAGESSLGTGEASFYGAELAGNRTASGETFDPARLTAAHRTLPLGSRVRVTNPDNGESVVVRINDRGPYQGNRVIDLSRAAAGQLGLIRAGTGQVALALLD